MSWAETSITWAPAQLPGRTMKEGTLSSPKLGDLWKKPSRCAREPGTRSAKLPISNASPQTVCKKSVGETQECGGGSVGTLRRTRSSHRIRAETSHLPPGQPLGSACLGGALRAEVPHPVREARIL